ncbi:MAG: hypothetical protein ACYTG7_19305, partial [Planctomycetota bacterium]
CVIGEILPVHIKGDPGDLYLLFASLGDGYVSTGYGEFRLDQAWLFPLITHVVPSSGLVELDFPIPRKPDLVGYEIHLQAVVGEEFMVGKSLLTNREALIISE